MGKVKWENSAQKGKALTVHSLFCSLRARTRTTTRTTTTTRVVVVVVVVVVAAVEAMVGAANLTVRVVTGLILSMSPS